MHSYTKRPYSTSRRNLLVAGGFGLLTGGLAGRLLAENRASGGKAKSCIFLFMWGGPSQLDTFDPKPDAPSEVRSLFSTIDTSVSGLRICEHFSRMATRMDRVALIRTLSHSDPAHLSSAHATVTGHLAPVLNSDQDPPSERDTPLLGSMMARLRQSATEVPATVMLPWKAYHPSAPGGVAPGQHGGWLGANYDPMLVEGDPSQPTWGVPALRLLDGISASRLTSRRHLLSELAGQQRQLEATTTARQWQSYEHRVVNLLTSPRVSEAFDIGRESDGTRDRYGRNMHGHCVLMARRLVEFGVPVVHVNWQNDGKSFWDTHGNNFNRLKDDLIPAADQALAALLDDLSERGMLDETIVAWVGEFGRKPQITPNNAGREHWPQCYCGLLAGGGIQGGAVFGQSDRLAAYPVSDPISPLDYAATIYHALGVDVATVLHDREGRPRRVGDGRALTSLFS